MLRRSTVVLVLVKKHSSLFSRDWGGSEFGESLNHMTLFIFHTVSIFFIVALRYFSFLSPLITDNTSHEEDENWMAKTDNL